MKTVCQQEEKLSDLLQKIAPESSKSTIKSWVLEGRVQVNGRAVRQPHHLVRIGAKVSVGKKHHYLKEDVQVLFEDRDLIVLYKPEGLLSVALDKGNAISVHEILKRRATGMVYPVHRLDRDTSGVLVFAYTEKARDHLKKQFFSHSVKREYVAVVEGEMKELKGKWESHLVEEANLSMRVTKNEKQGKRAVTHFKVAQVRNNRSLLRIRLETGRKNQIRVHVSEAGHPIIGDKKYGGHKSPIGRLGLHAESLGFIHPRTLKSMQFNIKCPDSFINLF